jgi:MoxR-like ATPase
MTDIFEQAARGAAIRGAPLDHVAELLPSAQEQVAKAVIGQDRVVELILVALLARGHLLLEGPPGTGKTLLARTIARLMGGYFRRVQFTPDTTADEIVGRVNYRGGEQIFEPGAVFTNVLLADEINRAPSRTQAALLEAMQEHAVTIEGKTRRIKSPFFVLATQNPFEHAGVYELPESQLDRFIFRVDLRYGSEADDVAMLDLPRRGITPDVIGEVTPLLDDAAVLLLQEAVDRVSIPDDVALTMVRIVRRTREIAGVSLGAGPRSMIHVLTGARALAALRGRHAVTVGHVVEIARHALPHRILAEDSGASVVERAIADVVPQIDAAREQR